MIIKLLKNIFSTSVITIVLTAATLYYAYKTFYRDNNGAITVMISHDDKEYSLNDKHFVFELAFSKDDHFYTSGSECHFPIFYNNTNRSVENFDISGFMDNYGVEVVYDSVNYEISETAYKSKYNNIKAFNAVPDIIDEITLKSLDNEVYVLYRYTYDQIAKPSWLLYYAMFSDQKTSITNKHHNSSLYMEIRNEFLDEVKDNYEVFLDDLCAITENMDELRQIYIIVGDTMVDVKNSNFFDESFDIESIKGLEELGNITILN